MKKPFPIGVLLMCAGIALLTSGVWQIHKPTAFILLGIIVGTLGFLNHSAKR